MVIPNKNEINELEERIRKKLNEVGAKID